MHRTDELLSQLHNTLRELARASWLALLVLVLTILRLAIVVARLFPFALRLAAFLLWSVGLLEVWRSVFALYRAFSDTIATTLTALAVVVSCAVIPIPFLRTSREMAWGRSPQVQGCRLL